MANDTAILSIKIKSATKAKFAALADEFGMTTTALANALIAQAVRSGRVELETASSDDGEPSLQLINDVVVARQDFAKGNYFAANNSRELAQRFKFLRKNR